MLLRHDTAGMGMTIAHPLFHLRQWQAANEWGKDNAEKLPGLKPCAGICPAASSASSALVSSAIRAFLVDGTLILENRFKLKVPAATCNQLQEQLRFFTKVAIKKGGPKALTR